MPHVIIIIISYTLISIFSGAITVIKKVPIMTAMVKALSPSPLIVYLTCTSSENLKLKCVGFFIYQMIVYSLKKYNKNLKEDLMANLLIVGSVIHLFLVKACGM